MGLEGIELQLVLGTAVSRWNSPVSNSSLDLSDVFGWYVLVEEVLVDFVLLADFLYISQFRLEISRAAGA